MKRILFPIDTTEEGLEERKNNDSKTKWDALDPLEIATMIARMAKENLESQSTPPLIKRRSLPPLHIDTNFLSTENPVLPPELSRCMQNLAIEEFDSTERTYLQSPMHHKAKISLKSTRDRKRNQIYPAPESTGYKKSICPWNPSFLLKHNPDQFAARDAVEQLTILARELESSECYEDYIPSYQRLRDRLLEESEFIFKSSNSLEGKRKHFSDLYASVIEQMHILIGMSEQMDESLDSSLDSITFDERDPGEKSPARPVVNIVRGEYSKIHFNEYMNNWMRENWTNPYCSWRYFHYSQLWRC